MYPLYPHYTFKNNGSHSYNRWCLTNVMAGNYHARCQIRTLSKSGHDCSETTKDIRRNINIMDGKTRGIVAAYTTNDKFVGIIIFGMIVVINYISNERILGHGPRVFSSLLFHLL